MKKKRNWRTVFPYATPEEREKRGKGGERRQQQLATKTLPPPLYGLALLPLVRSSFALTTITPKWTQKTSWKKEKEEKEQKKVKKDICDESHEKRQQISYQKNKIKPCCVLLSAQILYCHFFSLSFKNIKNYVFDFLSLIFL